MPDTISIAEKTKEEYNGLKANGQYKDRIFCDLFGDPGNKEAILSLYNALNNTDYDDPGGIELVTLSDAIYARMKNDVAFIIGQHLNLYEHQSTVNPNMPLRGLLYFAEEYTRMYWRSNPAIYGKTLLRIAAPRYVVLYNGTDDQPEEQELHLSDAFEAPSEGYEWTARVVNINHGKNKEIMEKCKTLSDYSELIGMIRRYRKEGLDMEAAITKAVDECIEKGILKDYLSNNRQKAISSLLCEYNEAATYQYIREEAKEEGKKEGKEEGIGIGWDMCDTKRQMETYLDCLNEGLPLDLARKLSRITPENEESALNPEKEMLAPVSA